MKRLSVLILIFLISAAIARAQSRSLITSQVSDSSRLNLPHSSHRLAQPAFDTGAVDPGLKMDRMVLVLGPAPEQEHMLRALVDSQQDKTSPDFHRWLSPEQFAQQFSPSVEDVQ